jgi:hypothetical protein
LALPRAHLPGDEAKIRRHLMRPVKPPGVIRARLCDGLLHIYTDPRGAIGSGTPSPSNGNAACGGPNHAA